MDQGKHNLYPIEGELGGHDGEVEGDEKTAPEESGMGMEKLAEKYETLKQQVEMHFDLDSQKEAKEVPVLKAPVQPSKEQWEQHQATHTPFPPWCRHCQAARTVRRQHPTKGRKQVIVPGVEKGVDIPTKTPIDYMYLHKRVGRFKSPDTNPPQLAMVDHKSGRVWAYRVPNKGVSEDAAWLPKRIAQDINNS